MSTKGSGSARSGVDPVKDLGWHAELTEAFIDAENDKLTAVLVVHDGAQRSNIYLAGGKVVHVEIFSGTFSDTGVPQQAVLEVLSWRKPKFFFQEEEESAVKSMSETIFSLARMEWKGQPKAEFKRKTQAVLASMGKVFLPLKFVVRNPDYEPYTDSLLTESGVVGRDYGVDLYLDHTSVSRCHASIHVDRGGLWVKDLGSANGTKVDGVKVEPDKRVSFHLMSKLEFGDVEVRVSNEALLQALIRKIDAKKHLEPMSRSVKPSPRASRITQDTFKFKLPKVREKV